MYSQIWVTYLSETWSLDILIFKEIHRLPAPMVWVIYIFLPNFYFKRPVGYNINRSIAIIYCWSLADPPDVPLVHYGKREVLDHISNMEPEFKLILRWMGSSSAEAPGASTQWGHSISISGSPKRITGS